MDCKDALAWLPAHVDLELSAHESAQLEQHLCACADCRHQLRLLTALHQATAARATLYPAPPGLEQRILAALPTRNEPAAGNASTRPWNGAWRNWGAALVSAGAVAWSIGLTVLQPSANEVLVDALVSSHVRASLTGHLADVASSDQHTVKPWFSGKLDFSPPVQDGAAAGFPLTGARVDYVDHRPVAALVYARRLHTIDVFVLPAASKGWGPDFGSTVLTQQGYQIVHWTHEGMGFWAVSDISRAELEQLRDILSSAPP